MTRRRLTDRYNREKQQTPFSSAYVDKPEEAVRQCGCEGLGLDDDAATPSPTATQAMFSVRTIGGAVYGAFSRFGLQKMQEMRYGILRPRR